MLLHLQALHACHGFALMVEQLRLHPRHLVQILGVLDCACCQGSLAEAHALLPLRHRRAQEGRPGLLTLCGLRLATLKPVEFWVSWGRCVSLQGLFARQALVGPPKLL